MDDLEIAKKSAPKIFFVDYSKKKEDKKNIKILSNYQYNKYNDFSNNLLYEKVHKIRLKPILPSFNKGNKTPNIQTEKIIYCFNNQNENLPKYMNYLNYKKNHNSLNNNNSSDSKNTFMNNLKVNDKIFNTFKNDINNLKVKDLLANYSENFNQDKKAKDCNLYSFICGQNYKELKDNINKLTNPFIIKNYSCNNIISNNYNTNNSENKNLLNKNNPTLSSFSDGKNTYNKITEENLKNANNQTVKKQPIILQGRFKRNYSTGNMGEGNKIVTPKNENLNSNINISSIISNNSSNIYKNNKILTLYKNNSTRRFHEISDEEYKNNLNDEIRYKPIINLKGLINNLNASKNYKQFNIRSGKVQDYTLKKNLKLVIDRDYQKNNINCKKNVDDKIPEFTASIFSVNNHKGLNEFNVKFNNPIINNSPIFKKNEDSKIFCKLSKSQRKNNKICLNKNSDGNNNNSSMTSNQNSSRFYNPLQNYDPEDLINYFAYQINNKY